MTTVHKYTVHSFTDGIRMQKGAELLAVGEQSGEVVLWAMVDPDAKKTTRVIRPVMTGEDVVDMTGGSHVGTVQRLDGIVVHVFDMGEQE
jgi:hypothetical protein